MWNTITDQFCHNTSLDFEIGINIWISSLSDNWLINILLLLEFSKTIICENWFHKLRDVLSSGVIMTEVKIKTFCIFSKSTFTFRTYSKNFYQKLLSNWSFKSLSMLSISSLEIKLNESSVFIWKMRFFTLCVCHTENLFILCDEQKKFWSLRHK